MRAGHYENDEAAVRQMIERSPARSKSWSAAAVRFARDEAGNFRFTREGGHSRPRILFHGDETGRRSLRTSWRRRRARDNLTILEYTEILDVIVGPEGCCGGRPAGHPLGRGLPRLCRRHPARDGRRGRTVPPFHQLPPPDGGRARHRAAPRHRRRAPRLCADPPDHPLFGKAGAALPHLRIGARRGRGASGQGGRALLQRADAARYRHRRHPRADAEGRHRPRLAGYAPVGERTLREHFPTIFARCRAEGYDPLQDPVPVVPAQHYFKGGVGWICAAARVCPALFAAGETACNGVHGKNRLASNSLLESLIWAERAAQVMGGFRTN